MRSIDRSEYVLNPPPARRLCEMSDEAELVAAHHEGDYARVVTLALQRYETEVYAFLVSNLGSESDAHDVFSQLCEDLWTGMASFAWRCSLRTWMYTLARNAAHRFRRAPANDPARRVRLSKLPDPIAARRTSTVPFRRTEVKDRFATLREQLEPDEQALLTLRLDRGLSWNDVARVLNDAPEADEATVQRLAVNLRQKYRALKVRVTSMARASGLFDDST